MTMRHAISPCDDDTPRSEAAVRKRKTRDSTVGPSGVNDMRAVATKRCGYRTR
jgi:hypothetical protein